MQLSANFSSDELLRSDAAVRLNIAEQFLPTSEVVNNLKALCENCLEPLRLLLNKPIHITSGYRCERVNKAIGGAANSQHVLGQAADCHVDGMTTQELYQYIKASIIPYNQLICEFAKSPNGGWVHISYNANADKHTCLIAEKVNGVTVYTPDNA